MNTTTTNVIRKNANGSYQFLTSALPSYCVMNKQQFADLIAELERLKTATASARNIPIAQFPEFQGFRKTMRVFIKKEVGGYLLQTNLHSDFLCRMNQAQFESLIGELIRLQDLASCAANQPEVYFPDFTYPITG